MQRGEIWDLHCPRNNGFTLVELLVTLAIAAILLGVGIPAFDSVSLSNKLGSYSNTLVASTQIARSEAIKRKAVVTMCVSADGLICSDGDWQQGWILLTGDTVIKKFPALSDGYVLSADQDKIEFQSSGMIDAPLVLTVCRNSPEGNQERVVTLSAMGRTSVAKTTTGVCD